MTSPTRRARRAPGPAEPVAGLVAALLAAACQAQPPEIPAPLPSAEARALSRFRLSDAQETTSPLDIVAADSHERVVEQPPHDADDELTFEEVLRSVEAQFPLVLAALEEVEIAAGQLLAAHGDFDSRVRADADLALEGFYENERMKLMLEQPTTLWGATFFGGYKLGTGDFAVWDGDLKTRTDGELSAGFRLPLLAGRRIDERRLRVWQARLAQAQADPLVLRKRLEATRKAARAYWKWVAAGQKLTIAQRLLALAENRQEALRTAVDEGELPGLALIDNQRLIVERQSILVRSQRGLERSAIELSLYWRDELGRPLLPDPDQLPAELPNPRDPAQMLSDEDVVLAQLQRPEVRELELELERLRLDLEQAENTLLPKLDVGLAGSQDLGDQVTTPDDKGPFELEAAVRFEVPLQRRAARGKSRTIAAKANKLERELQFVRDRIVADVQDASSALRQTWLRIGQVRENARLAGTLEQAERIQLQAGESDLLRVNLREQQTAAAASMLVDVLAEHFQALADYRASLGLPYDEVVAGEPTGGAPEAPGDPEPR